MSIKGTILKVISTEELTRLDSFVYQHINASSVWVDAALEHSVMLFVLAGNVEVFSTRKLTISEKESKVIILPKGSRADVSISAGSVVITFAFLNYFDLLPMTIAEMQLLDGHGGDTQRCLTIPPYVRILLQEIRAFLADKEIPDVVHRVYFAKVIRSLEKYYGSKNFASFFAPIVCERFNAVEKYHKMLLASENRIEMC